MSYLFPIPKPDILTNIVYEIHKHDNILPIKSPQKISRSGRIRNDLSSQRIYVRLIVSQQFNILQTGTACKNIKNDVQNVIGFMVGEMALQQIEFAVDFLSQP